MHRRDGASPIPPVTRRNEALRRAGRRGVIELERILAREAAAQERVEILRCIALANSFRTPEARRGARGGRR